MVRRFSGVHGLIADLRMRGTGRTGAVALVNAVCGGLGVPVPEVTFHGRRGPHTGWCRPPRDVAVRRWSEEAVRRSEDAGQAWPTAGMLRFGDPTSLGTIAHELGHHLVHVLEPPSTPSHGKRWVARFDEAATAIHAVLTESGRT